MPTFQTDNAGQVVTVATPRSELRTGDQIVLGNIVYVVREPIQWELRDPQHWLWTRRVDSPELTAEQLRELRGDSAMDGTGYGFLSDGPDHIYERVVTPGEATP